jgi:hypothetical protein
MAWSSKNGNISSKECSSIGWVYFCVHFKCWVCFVYSSRSVKLLQSHDAVHVYAFLEFVDMELLLDLSLGPPVEH